MTWNIKIIKDKMQDIINKLEVENNTFVRFFLIDTFILLRNLLKLCAGLCTNEDDLLLTSVIDNKEIRDSSNFFSARINDIRKKQEEIALEYSGKIKSNKKIINRVKLIKPNEKCLTDITETDYLKTIEDFLYDLYPDMTLMYKYMQNGYIHFSDKIYDKRIQPGHTVSPPFDDDTYIFVYNPLSNPVNLPHEIAHAYEFNMLRDFDKKIYYSHFILGEINSNLLELMYCEHFLNTKHKNLLLKTIYQILEEIKIVNYNVKCKRNDYDNMELYFGKLFAVHLYYLYLTDTRKYEIVLSKYSDYLMSDMNRIWELFDIDDATNSYVEVANYYNGILRTRSPK